MNLLKIENLPQIDKEFFETILKQDNLEIKRIISNTLKTPQQFCSNKNEFVILLKGCAKIEIENEVKKLKSGDWLFIAKNTSHTLIKTKKTAIWLAIYFD